MVVGYQAFSAVSMVLAETIKESGTWLSVGFADSTIQFREVPKLSENTSMMLQIWLAVFS